MKALLNVENCPRAIYYQYILSIPTPPSDLMLRGQYFEHHVIGSTRGGTEPVLPTLKTGGDSKIKKDLDILIEKARMLLNRLGITSEQALDTAIIQPYLVYEELEGHPDYIANDFKNVERRAIYELKYTETAINDRWNGWAELDNRPGDKFQAVHYINLYYELYGVWVPFYFLIFGKAGWVRILKIEVTELSMQLYEQDVGNAKIIFNKHNSKNWQPNTDFNKCQACPYLKICPDAINLPEVEVFQI